MSVKILTYYGPVAQVSPFLFQDVCFYICEAIYTSGYLCLTIITSVLVNNTSRISKITILD